MIEFHFQLDIKRSTHFQFAVGRIQVFQRLTTRISTAPLQPFYTPTTVQTIRFGINNQVHRLTIGRSFVSLNLRIYRQTRRPIGSNQRLFQGYPPRLTSIPFFLKSCRKSTRMFLPDTYRKHLIRDSDSPRFMFCVYGSGFGLCTW